VALTRAFGPFLSGNLFAWSATNGYSYPLDYHFMFHSLAVIMIPIVLLSRLLPKRFDVPKLEQFELVETENGMEVIENEEEQADLEMDGLRTYSDFNGIPFLVIIHMFMPLWRFT
jgi:hypothetical protein